MRISDREHRGQREVWMSSDSHDLLMTFGGRAFVIAIALAIVAAVALFGRVYGQHLAHMAMEERDSAIRKLETQSQQLELGRTDRKSKVKALQTQIASLQAQLSAIVPSKNMYSINPNQRGGWHLTIGLFNSPSTNGNPQ